MIEVLAGLLRVIYYLSSRGKRTEDLLPGLDDFALNNRKTIQSNILCPDFFGTQNKFVISPADPSSPVLNYTILKNTCDESSRISAAILDDFLIHYAAEQDNLSHDFDVLAAPYEHLTIKNANWRNMIETQYVGHRIFKAGGLLRKYLNQAEVKRRSHDEQQFLKDHLVVPWRFCFSRVIGNPSPDFYMMEDVLLNTTFLLYSKGTTQTLTQQSAMLWFNLIAFNGACWQTHGPVNAYQSFDPDDILFFATQLDDEIDSDESLAQDVEMNPVPYMMLLNGGRMPVVVNKEDQLMIIFSAENLTSIDVEKLRPHFKVEFNDGVFRITAKDWADVPHLAAAYFEEDKGMVLLTAMTDRGFAGLVSALNKHGFDIPAEPQIRIHPSMFATAKLILQRDLAMNPYEHLFFPKSTDPQNAELDKINRFLQSVLPAINAGKKIDVETAAREAGIDIEFAKRVIGDTIDKVGRMKKGK
ncbi:MAG: hypothetical protein ABIS36_05200 [Chryseolinea sp.]